MNPELMGPLPIDLAVFCPDLCMIGQESAFIAVVVIEE
jgi:hypothetical protein